MQILNSLLKDFQEALENYHQSLSLKEKCADSVGKIYCIRYDWSYLYYLNNYDIAKEYIQKAIDYFEKTNNLTLLAKQYNNLGICLFNLGKYSEAIEAYYKSLQINEKLNKKIPFALTT